MKNSKRLAVLWPCLAFLLSAGAASADGSSQLLPDFDNMKLRFGTGAVVGNHGEISPIMPNISGTPSPWWVTQWTHMQKISADQMKQQDPATADPLLGMAAYSYTTSDARLHLWVYPNGPGGHPVYELFERGGSLSKGGGSNLFLSAKLLQRVTLDHSLDFSTLAKVSRASVSYDTPAAKKSGAVLGNSFVGFTIGFPSPVDGSPSTLFLQVPLANSNDKGKFHNACKMSNGGRLVMIAGGSLTGMPPLMFKASDLPLTTVSFTVNDYISKLLSEPTQCHEKGQGLQSVDLTKVSPASMVVKSIYVGLETENIDNRPSSAAPGQPQGDVQLGLQLSNLQLTEGD
jgi:hypothetical protein